MSNYNGSTSLQKRTRPDYSENDTEYELNDDVKRKRPELPPNHVLLYTINYPQYPITTDVINTISSPYGKVMRIVIFRKYAVQAMVEFDSVDSARKAKKALDGADIYSGCCTLKIEYAKPSKLNVFRNDQYTWDFTNGRMPDNRAPLLPEPPSRINSSFGNSVANYVPDHYEDIASVISDLQPSMGSLRGERPPFTDPRILVGGNTAIAPMPVLMIYDLNPETANCDRLFNLLCLYGNVVRIKFLKSKPGCAMVQMSDNYAVDRCMANLNPIQMLDNRTVCIGYSKQAFISQSIGDSLFKLPDGTSAFKDYTLDKNNRFNNSSTALKNRIQQPSKILHFYNTPTTLTEDEMIEIFHSSLNGISICDLKIFSTSEEARSSSGLVEFASIPESIEALMICNHRPITVEGFKFPYIMKLCFSAAKKLRQNKGDNN